MVIDIERVAPLWRAGDEMRAGAEDAQRAARILRTAAGDMGWRSEAGDRFRTHAEMCAERAGSLSSRFSETGRLLLSEAEARAAS
ncbi:hypothetical protein [Microbacterium sp. gxy059]|uniref:hypothetical protein n=1 Tax=Microbacterium sp. gxy059 TaxID=2957199 RepID=UPI003D9A088A